MTGVGPKVALAIVGSRARCRTSSWRSCSRTRRSWSSIPGIGKRLAERVIFELKEKVAAAGTAALAGVGGPVGGETEVVGALQALGYSAAEAREASRAALVDPAIGGTLWKIGSRLRFGRCCANERSDAGL